MSGTIVKVAPDVERWAISDPVTMMPLAWDGTCQACLAGNEHVCQNPDFIGIDSPGTPQ
jgi:threonine dehydrogenase-like Zn-dependent dehydrogenase